MKRSAVASFSIALILAAFPFPIAAAAATTANSHNWAGYVVVGTGLTSISSEWTIPQIPSSSIMTGDATWIGIGGMQSSDLIQAGTRALTGSAGATYEAWYELLPVPATKVAMQVEAGDEMSVSITEDSLNLWTISIDDATSGASFSTSVPYYSSLNSAEWIDEAPQENGAAVPLDAFSSIPFSDARATENGNEETPAALNATRVSLVNQSLTQLATPSALLSGGGAFTIIRD